MKFAESGEAPELGFTENVDTFGLMTVAPAALLFVVVVLLFETVT